MRKPPFCLFVAVSQFRKDWPFMAVALDDMRQKAIAADRGEARATKPLRSLPSSPRPVTRGESTPLAGNTISTKVAE